jgi:hypothetical protein
VSQNAKFRQFFPAEIFDTNCKVEIFLEQREVAFLSPSKICENFAG